MVEVIISHQTGFFFKFMNILLNLPVEQIPALIFFPILGVITAQKLLDVACHFCSHLVQSPAQGVHKVHFDVHQKLTGM